MLVFRMSKQFPNEIKKTHNAKESIVSAKVKMNMIHEAFFTIFALLVAMLDIGILFYAWKTQNLTVGSVVALIALIENAYTPIAIFNVLYVQYKLDKTLVNWIVSEEKLKGLYGMLLTSDAQGLYSQYGFSEYQQSCMCKFK